MENGRCWFARCGCHTILAACLAATITAIGAYYVSGNIAKASLIKAFIPDLISKNPQQIKIATYAIRIGISEEAAKDIEELVGVVLADNSEREVRSKNMPAARKYIDTAAYISPAAYKGAMLRLDSYKEADDAIKADVEQLIKYKPQPFNLLPAEGANSQLPPTDKE